MIGSHLYNSHPQAVAYLRARRGVARANGKLRGGAAVSERARLNAVPITLPAISIQRDE